MTPGENLKHEARISLPIGGERTPVYSLERGELSGVVGLYAVDSCSGVFEADEATTDPLAEAHIDDKEPLTVRLRVLKPNLNPQVLGLVASVAAEVSQNQPNGVVVEGAGDNVQQEVLAAMVASLAA